MHPLFLYAIKVIVCSGILVGYYWLALRNKVFHHYNRFFLMAAVVLSLAAPVIKIGFWQPHQNAAPVIRILQAVNADNETLDEIVLTSKADAFNWEKLYINLYLFTAMILLIIFIQALLRIYIIYKKGKRIKTDEISLIQTEAKGTPFSFFKLIFWNMNIDLTSTTGQQILQHEIAHVQQKHSYDKVFLNLVLIACWFNPIFLLIRKELNMIHEFTADQKAVKDSDSSVFAAMILQAAYPQHRFNLTNQFFYSPIKRRLMMLSKNTHSKAGYISRIMVLPLAALVFVAFTFKAKTFIEKPYNGKKITVVIDAGHGGKDNGATDGNGNYEKDISLAIAQKIKELNSNSNINIVLSRETDIYQSPPEKANFVNEQKADLMVSIHTDGTEENNVKKKSGMNIWVVRDEFANATISKIFASAIVEAFKQNYPLPVPKQPMQKIKGIWILQASNCPAALIEAGNINNINDLAFLQTNNGKELIAKNVLKGIEQYLLAKEAVAIKNVITDTLPTTANNEIDTKKALIIENGKAIGIGEAGEKGRTIEADSMHVIWLKPDAAMAKYGEKAKYGACELTYSNKVSYKAFDEEKQLIILNGKVIGTGKEAKAALNGIDKSLTNNLNVTICQLQPKEAVQKYGSSAEYGASVVTYNYDSKEERSGKIELKEVTPDKLGNKPLYVIDGKIMTIPDPLKSISPENIDRINVLKNASAIAMYGEKGVNGVVEIFTKLQPISPLKEMTKTPNSNHLNEIVLVAPKLNGEEKEADEPIFTIAENNPTFPGGDEAWKKYLMQNLRADMPLTEGWKAGVYKITVSFIVKKDGSITDVKTDDYPSSKTAEQCINMIKNGPKWEPAVQNGHKVNCYKKQPITFVVEGVK
jgi:TonB-dependent SusC/RagA subfamily outer membrane receptor